MNLAPIVLFTYNRPWHTRQTLDALSKNYLANESKLIIFSDGPKENATEEDIAKINEVRKITSEKQWCKDIEIRVSEKNKGLADSIIEGVTEVVNKYGKIIVLEDDLVTSVGFLRYMNDALSLYEDEERVMHISGYMFPVKKKLPSTFFYNVTSCWGWGTWKRAWINFEHNPSLLINQIEQEGLVSKFNIENSYNFFEHLILNESGKMKTWAVLWYASVFLKAGLCLHPYPSLVNNIGHDGGGENCGKTSKYDWKKLNKKIVVSNIKLNENKFARKLMFNFNNNISCKTIDYKYIVKLLLPPIIILIYQKILKTKLISCFFL